jgi:para-aminobenzoate synthetase / 4-amino-4-deoxychorismate lyase
MTAFDPTAPFVLLDDARRQGGGATLFTGLCDVVAATTPDAIAPAFEGLRQAVRDGLWAAGFVSFEAGYALEPRLRSHFRAPDKGLPLLWFGLFERRQKLDAAELEARLQYARARVASVEPRIDQAQHLAMVRAAQALIAAGDIYQANVTFPADIRFSGHPLALYSALRHAQAAPYGAVVHTGAAWALSFSPELFFELEDRRLTTRPMKGTAARSPQAGEDRHVAEALAADPKNRAENLMIVDLLRNDLSRVAEAGSVAVADLFRVDTYPTVHQMTSTVGARLPADRDAVDVLAALFPCGSVTGAPKIRAMEVIAELEAAPRGLYTGSIGCIGPDGGARFNVAIRTLVTKEADVASLGLGSGIVADSDAAAEWAECLTKAAFLTHSPKRFDLIETMRFDPDEGLVRAERHIDRLATSARHWGFRLDRHSIRNVIQATVGELRAPARVRLLLSANGEVAAQASDLPPLPAEPVAVALAALTVEPGDPRLFHKTTDRDFYDEPRRASGAFEVVFVNNRGELTEGSFTSLFVPRDGKLLTPPLGSGLLPGVLRAEMLEAGEAVEAVLTPADLPAEFFIGNSLRGLMRARRRT